MGRQAKKMRRKAARDTHQTHLVSASVVEIKEEDKVVGCVLVQRNVLPGIPIQEEADRADQVATDWYLTGERPAFANEWVMIKVPQTANNKEYLERVSQEPLAFNSIRDKLQRYLNYDFRIERTPAEKAPDGSWESWAIGRVHMGSGVSINTKKRLGVGETAALAERGAVIIASDEACSQIERMKKR